MTTQNPSIFKFLRQLFWLINLPKLCFLKNELSSEYCHAHAQRLKHACFAGLSAGEPTRGARSVTDQAG